MTARFAAPTALDDALAVLAADPAARPVAGGTDLVVAARQGRKPLPDSIVAIESVRPSHPDAPPDRRGQRRLIQGIEVDAGRTGFEQIFAKP